MTPRAVLRTTAVFATVFATACAAKEVPPPPPPNVVSVHATDYAFHAPASIPSGMTTFKLANGGQTFHHIIIARLDSGKTVADAQAAFAKPGPPPAWLANIGGPNASDPNGESNATLDLQPGEYVLYCVVDLPGGVPHVAKGMISALTVTPSTGPAAAAPTADIDLELFDYNFALSKPVTAGSHTFKVSTRAGAQPHEVELMKLAEGKTADDFMKWMGGKMDTPPPVSGIGGALALVPGGQPVYFTADFTPGEYMIVCFVPDSKDGKPHVMHGMMQSFKVQ
ncbi:MAG TPA: hypothetical protein VJR92_06855 [Gemmatimonadaceae bacterium]|nr:hypothetical protein [Gemmatimonadaceae bacterium]